MKRATWIAVAVGLAGAWPNPASGRPDPLACASWLALWALPAGAWCAPRAGALGSRAMLVPLVAPLVAWAVAAGLVQAAAQRGLPEPGWGALAVAALFWSGFALGCTLDSALATRERVEGSRAVLVAWLLVAGAGSSALPTRAGLAGPPWPAAVASRALDLSPTAWVAECAGVDWMRRPAIYEGAGSDRFLRVPYARVHAVSGAAFAALWVALALIARNRLAAARGAAPRQAADGASH